MYSYCTFGPQRTRGGFGQVRALISGRTKSALAAAKARGVQLGNPNIKAARRGAVAAIKAQADRAAGNVTPIISKVRRAGAVSLRQIANRT